jgi:cell wall-associated NlpC family hydrolase
VSVTLAAIPAWGSTAGSTVTSAATALESAAPTGAFAGVLAEVSATLEAGPAAAATGTSAAGASGETGVTGSATPTGYSTLSLSSTPPAGSPWMVGMPASGTAAGSVAAEAERFLGAPYVWGGDSPAGFDCSGLVQYVYCQLGVSLPRTSEEQAQVGTPVASLATAVPGDLVFFPGSDGTAASPGHVGIYLGDGMMIDAPHTGTDVQIQQVSSAGTPVAIRRIVGTSGTSSAGSAVPAALAPLFTKAADTYGVPAALLSAVARHESGFDTSAVSTAGAEGLMQIMPSTAAGLGVTPFTPGQAIDGAAQILSGDLHHFGSVPLALAAYNAGAGAVEEYGGVPPYAQTESYVESIMRTLAVPG